ncbi:MAG: hypothetical protein IJE05_03480 [Clostridia bacterium]|nr:hypothetical protein [Clostridia bacterium]
MSSIELKSFKYSDEERFTFRGTREEIEKKMDQGYYIIRGGQGEYLLGKSSEMEIVLEIDEKEETFDVKNLIRKEYGQEKLTKSIFEKFIKDLKNGDKVLDFDKEHGLSIK